MSGVFETFIAGMTTLLDTKPSESDLLPVCGKLLGELVATDDWLPDAYATSNPETYCQYLLYKDPDSRFSVVSFVWGIDQESPIHDHRVWGAIGMLRGSETGTLFSRDAKTGALTEGDSLTLTPGMVDFVSPRLGDIHRVKNAERDQASISIHIYGADIGAIERRVYDPKTGEPSPFVSGYTPLPQNS